MSKRKAAATQDTLIESPEASVPTGPLQYEIVATPGTVDDSGEPSWEMKARLSSLFSKRHLEAADLIGESVRVEVVGGDSAHFLRVHRVLQKLDKDSRVVVELATSGDTEAPGLLGRIVTITRLQDRIPGSGVRAAAERFQDHVDEMAAQGVTVSTGFAGDVRELKPRSRRGRSVAITKDDAKAITKGAKPKGRKR